MLLYAPHQLSKVSERMHPTDLQNKWINTTRPWLLLMVVLLFSSTLKAEDSEDERDGVYLQIGRYIHFSDREEHDGPPVLVAANRLRPRGYYYGLALFNNSFNQFSQFLYVGREFQWQRLHEGFRFKLALGVVHSYRDEFEDELPLSYKGYSPGLIPSISFMRNQMGLQLSLLSNAGLAVALGYQF